MVNGVDDNGDEKQPTSRKDVNMEVITIVEGKVPISKAKEFETAYESHKDSV